MAWKNFDRQYRMIAGQGGATGMQIGSGDAPLHINFDFEKSDLETQNTGKIDVWNLSDAHIAELERQKCIVALSAGYGNNLPLIFSGYVTYAATQIDGGDRRTHIELVDSLVSAQDTYVSVSYKGRVNWQTIFEDVAAQMGAAITYSYNAEFTEVSNGYSYVGLAKGILNAGCQSCGLSWSIQNGVIQIKRPGDAMQLQGYEISAETGMIGLPERVVITDDENLEENTVAWDVSYFLNGAINVNDYVKLVSKKITGYFYVYSLQMTGDNVTGDWLCTARLIELTRTDGGSGSVAGRQNTGSVGTGTARTDMYVRNGP